MPPALLLGRADFCPVKRPQTPTAGKNNASASRLFEPAPDAGEIDETRERSCGSGQGEPGRLGRFESIEGAAGRFPRSKWWAWPNAARTPLLMPSSAATTPPSSASWRVCLLVQPGMLVLAERGFFSYSLWSGAQAAGAELLWRTKRNHVLPVEERLADGSFLSTIYPTQTDRRHGTGGVVMRVVEYVLGQPAGTDDGEMTYRLLTTVLDPDKAPVAELAALYAQRWVFETALDELKSHIAVRGWVFAPRCPTVSARRPTHTCACTTPSAGSCTPLGHAHRRRPCPRLPRPDQLSPEPSGRHAAPRPTRVFPLTFSTTHNAELRPSCSPSAATEPTLDW